MSEVTTQARTATTTDKRRLHRQRTPRTSRSGSSRYRSCTSITGSADEFVPQSLPDDHHIECEPAATAISAVESDAQARSLRIGGGTAIALRLCESGDTGPHVMAREIEW